MKLKLALLLSLIPVLLLGQERISLPQAMPSVNAFNPGSLTISVEPDVYIQVTLVHAATGKPETFFYPCSEPCAFSTPVQVQTMITSLNTANLSTRSLWRRIMDRLLLDFPTRFPSGATVQ